MAPIALDFQIPSGAHANMHRKAKPPVLAQNPVLRKTRSTDTALRQMVGACLQQILPNAIEVASGAGTAEHLHQTRIGLRRLRSALLIFGDWSTACDPNWRSRLGDLFARLGSTRDQDMLEATVLSELRAIEAPLAQLPPDTHGDMAVAVLRNPDCAQLFRELIAFSQSPQTNLQTSSDLKKGRLRKLAATHFEHLHRQLAQDAKAYPRLNEVQRHRARKRLKRLRYCVELLSSVFPPKKVNRFLVRLRPAQNVLGQYNDLMVADSAFRQQREADPRAWFAVGWIAAKRTHVLREVTRSLGQVARAPTFW